MGAIRGRVAVSVKGDWVMHKVLYTSSSIAFPSSRGTTAVLLLLSYEEDVGVGCESTMQLR